MPLVPMLSFDPGRPASPAGSDRSGRKQSVRGGAPKRRRQRRPGTRTCPAPFSPSATSSPRSEVAAFPFFLTGSKLVCVAVDHNGLFVSRMRKGGGRKSTV